VKGPQRVVTRKHRRFLVTMPGTLVQRDQFRHKGSLRDLSAKGCRVESLINPFTGMQMSLLLHVPGEAQPIKIENATVRWCGSQGIGIEFLIVAEPEQARLGHFIQQLEKTVPGS
jgi:PilZ domain